MDDSPKTVGLGLYPGCTLLDFAGATQIFARWASHWDPVWVAAEAGPVPTSEGLDVVASCPFDDHPPLDIVFVPGGSGAGVAATMRDERYLDWLRRVAAPSESTDGSTDGPWMGAVCVGTFIMAAAGLLNGATVTTHWRLLDTLRRLAPAFDMTVASGYPRACLDVAARRFTGGGVSSSIDLALALLCELSDVEVADRAALIVQYAPKIPDGIAPGSPELTNPATLRDVETNPVVTANFVGPIDAAASELEGRGVTPTSVPGGGTHAAPSFDKTTSNSSPATVTQTWVVEPTNTTSSTTPASIPESGSTSARRSGRAKSVHDPATPDVSTASVVPRTSTATAPFAATVAGRKWASPRRSAT